MSISDDDRDGFGEMALMVRSFQLSKMLQVAARAPARRSG